MLKNFHFVLRPTMEERSAEMEDPHGYGCL